MSDTPRKGWLEGDEGILFAEFFRKKKEIKFVSSLPDSPSLSPSKEAAHDPFILLPIPGVLPPSRILTVLDGGDGWGIRIGYSPPEAGGESGDWETCSGVCPEEKACHCGEIPGKMTGPMGCDCITSNKFDDYCNWSDEALS